MSETSNNTKRPTIQITQRVSAPRERVFEAFIRSEDLMCWYYASDGWTTPYVEVDPRVGGRFKIAFRDPTGVNTFDFTGMYTEVSQPERLAYTIDDGRAVRVDFADADGQTIVTITFEMESVNSEERQREGWSAQLTHLAKYLVTV